MNKKKIYAAYGSNMNIMQMKVRCPAAEKICTGILRNYQLSFRHGGVATIIPVDGSEVPVVLWNITEDCEKRLDIYEGFPRLYVKENTQIESEIGIMSAMAYVMADNYAKLKSRPNKVYFEIIQDGYLQNDIDLGTLHTALKTSGGQSVCIIGFLPVDFES